MSWEANAWVLKLEQAPAGEPLEPIERHILLLLSIRHNHDFRAAYPKQNRLATESGWTLRTVANVINSLERKGVLAIGWEQLPGGKMGSVYRFIGLDDIPPGAKRRGVGGRPPADESHDVQMNLTTVADARRDTEQMHVTTVADESHDIARPYSGRISKRIIGRINGERAHALTPQQLVVNEWMTAIGRDPYAAKDFARYMSVAGEMAERGDTPQDVRNCTKYLASDPWRMEKARPPTLADVRDGLPPWIEMKRPGTYRAQPRIGTVKPKSAIDNIADELRAIRAQEEAAQHEPDDSTITFAPPVDIPLGAWPPTRQLPQHPGGQ